MTDKSPYYTTFISKRDLATLLKSQAALRGWCARYRREIGGLERGGDEPIDEITELKLVLIDAKGVLEDYIFFWPPKGQYGREVTELMPRIDKALET